MTIIWLKKNWVSGIYTRFVPHYYCVSGICLGDSNGLDWRHEISQPMTFLENHVIFFNITTCWCMLESYVCMKKNCRNFNFYSREIDGWKIWGFIIKKTLVLWNFYRQFYWIVGMLYSIISVNFFGSDCIVEGRAPVSPATWCRSRTCWTAEVGPAFSIFPCVSTSVGNCTSEGLYTTSVFILKVNFFKINRYSNVHDLIWICKHNEIRLRNSTVFYTLEYRVSK